jgi:plasmid stabilization system protein ParE
LLLSDELRRAFELIREHPGIGKRAIEVEAEGIQRYHLRGTNRYLYYLVQGDVIEVLRLWGSQREPPRP